MFPAAVNKAFQRQNAVWALFAYGFGNEHISYSTCCVTLLLFEKQSLSCKRNATQSGKGNKYWRPMYSCQVLHMKVNVKHLKLVFCMAFETVIKRRQSVSRVILFFCVFSLCVHDILLLLLTTKCAINIILLRFLQTKSSWTNMRNLQHSIAAIFTNFRHSRILPRVYNYFSQNCACWITTDKK